MIATAELSPPASIAELAERRGVFAVLAVPWGEQPVGPVDGHPAYPLAPGAVGLPDPADVDAGRVGVNYDHGRAGAGLVLHAVNVLAEGLWVAVKLGHAARDLVRRGYTSVSAETDDHGRLSGLALMVCSPAAFPSARIVFSGDQPSRVVFSGSPPSQPPPDVSFDDVSFDGGPLVLLGPRMPPPEPTARPAMDMTGYDRELASWFGMGQMEADVRNARTRYAERLRDRAVRDAERVEEQLLDACVPAFLWPEDTATYRGWVVLLEQQRAADEQRQAAADRAALAELQASIRDQDEIRDERRPSWLTRLGRASAQALSYR